jgi:hypothetical protein
MVSTVDDEEIFKTCLEFWHHFCKELYTYEAQFRGATTPFGSTMVSTYLCCIFIYIDIYIYIYIYIYICVYI